MVLRLCRRKRMSTSNLFKMIYFPIWRYSYKIYDVQNLIKFKQHFIFYSVYQFHLFLFCDVCVPNQTSKTNLSLENKKGKLKFFCDFKVASDNFSCLYSVQFYTLLPIGYMQFSMNVTRISTNTINLLPNVVYTVVYSRSECISCALFTGKMVVKW